MTNAPISSMTGRGSGHADADGIHVDVELSSVNRRQLDLVLPLPRSVAALEADVLTLVQSRLVRGRVSGAVRVAADSSPAALTLNFAQLRHMMSTGRYSELHIVYGIMADKALADIIPLMPREATFWFVTPDTPRALNADQIARQYLEAVPEASGGHSVRAFDTVAAGLEAMERFLRPDSLVYIGGSTYVVSDAIKYYRK